MEIYFLNLDKNTIININILEMLIVISKLNLTIKHCFIIIN